MNFKINTIKRKAYNTQIHTDVIILPVDDGRWPGHIPLLESLEAEYRRTIFKLFSNF